MARIVGLVVRPGATALAQRLLAEAAAGLDITFLVEERGLHAPAADAEGAGWQRVDAARLASDSQMLLVLGGDGTLLHAAGLLRERVVPILAVNLGHIGFLTEVTQQELPHTLPRALAGELAYEDRMRLDVAVVRQGRVMLERRILNDASIAMRSLARIATFVVAHQGREVTAIRGDGVLFSTPTGSTAYALAAGGPIVSPALTAIGITPICPHQLTQRPLVVPATDGWSVTLLSDSPVIASFDGHVGQKMQRGDQVTLARAPVPTRLLQVPWRSYYETLRAKLSWGAATDRPR